MAHTSANIPANTSASQSASAQWRSAARYASVSVLLCCLLLSGLVILIGYANDLTTPRITSVQGVSSHALTFPETDSDWQMVTLPFRLCPVSSAPCYDHYRIDLAGHSGPLAIFFPGFTGSLRVAVNDVQIALFGTLAPPVEQLVFQPQLVPIPDHLRRSDGDVLQLTIGADRDNFLRLDPFFVAHPQALSSGWRLARLLSVDLLVVSTGIYVVLGFLAGLTWLLSERATRNELFVWFAAIALCAAVRNSFFLWTNPSYDFLRQMVYFQSSLGMLAAIVGFTGALVGLGRSRIYILLCTATLPIVMLFGWAILQNNYEGSHMANTAVRGAAVATGVFTLVLLARHRATQFERIKAWIFGMFGGAFLLVLHDVVPSLVQTSMRYQLSNLAPLLLVLAFCFILAHQFSQALRRIRQHNATLERALALREQDLHVAYQQIRERERTEAVHAERTRILQDVHDGVAGRLAGLVLMARRRGEERMAQHIQTSLVDLRLIMDSLDERISDNLQLSLATFRERVQPLLQDHGLDTHWHINCPADLRVPADWILNILRAVQEALNNTLQHADASRVDIHATVEQAVMTLSVRDNGQGFDTASSASTGGRGLAHIRQRIARCGGEVVQQSLHPGSAVHMRVPVPGDPQESGGSTASPDPLASAS